MRERLAKIVAELDGFKALETFSEEEVTNINALNEEFASLRKNIEARETIEQITASTNVSARKVAPATPRVEVVASKIDKMGGFKGFGDFLTSVKAAASGNIDRRFQNTMFEKSGEDGGFLVPETMMTEISKKVQGDESLLARCSTLPVSGNSMSLPTDETQPWTGGVQAYWTAEGAGITSSKERFGMASWRLHKLAALVPVTDELLEDARAIESYIQAKAPVAMTYKINDAILNGNGVGKPTGLLNSSFRVTVAKESGQTADTIVARNVIKMYNRMIPSSIGNAVWVINPACRDQLRTMKDDQGNFIYLSAGSQMNNGPYDLLLGRPVIALLGGVKGLGDEGDIMFVDFSYYSAIYKASGIKNSVSTHLLFDQDKTAYKFIFRIDGSCPFKSPVTTEFGAYEMSGIVTLADRA